MPIFRHLVCVVGAWWLIAISAADAKQTALIIIGTAGSPSVASDLAAVEQTIHDALVQRGIADADIEVMGLPTANGPGKVTRDQVLASLKKQEALAATDEFSLILLGISARNSEDISAFQVSGPRLTVTDLKTALGTIPAKQFVFIGTSDAGGFVQPLLQSNRVVLAATAEEGEIDLPRYPESWAAALKEKPQADWKDIAARAAELTDKTYTDSGLVSGEHARFGDPVSGKILEAPFATAAVAKPADKPTSDKTMTLISASDIKVEIDDPNAEWEKHAATDETKKLIATARGTPNPDGFSSIMLEQRLGFKVGDDRTAEDFVMQRVYLTKEDGVARWANFTLPEDPPAVTSKLEAARIIQPDGSSIVFNPAKVPQATSDAPGGMGQPQSTIFLPNAHAGCLIEIAYRSRHLLDVTMPAFSEELSVQQDIPVLLTELQLQVSPTSKVHFKLRNSDLKPTEAVVNGMRTISWKLENMPAFEPLPGDPPERDLVVALDVSSLDSWDDFAAWSRRLFRGSDTQDDTVKEKAKELAAGATTRMEKLRKAYEFVSSLRYVAIEFGINGLRPRTPTAVLQNRYGDCKDKANLLVALLADMGIEGHLSVLNRGSSTDVDFPSWQFNHAIAYVPKAPDAGQPDDLWLDTTDSTAPFPTLSPGDLGRAAFVFGKDSAKFMTVTEPGKEITKVSEHWILAEKKATAPTAPNTLEGTLETTWTGLAEYTVRSEVRGLSPRQRDFGLQKELSRQLANADFTKLSLTPADDLSLPMRLDAQVSLPVVEPLAWPQPGMALDPFFASPERNRPLLINNGQKLHLIQTVDMTYDAGGTTMDRTPPDYDEQAAGIHVTIQWKRVSDHACMRVAELTVDKPLVAAADYVAVRRMLRNWTDRLSR